MARRAVEALLATAAEPVSSTEELLERLLAAARELAEARPAMGAVAHAVGRLVASAQTASHLPAVELQRLVAEEGNALIDSRNRAATSIAVQLAPQLEDALVLTHSASATVRESVLRTPPARLYCTTSAPCEEGRPLAENLRREGLDVVVLDDAEVLRTLAGVSLVLVGADTVFEDGSIENKIGTRPLAETAHEKGVPFVVACEVLKLAPVPPTLVDELDLRDLTPAELVDQIVTEEGCVVPEDVGPLLDRTPFLRDGYRLVKP